MHTYLYTSVLFIHAHINIRESIGSEKFIYITILKIA